MRSTDENINTFNDIMTTCAMTQAALDGDTELLTLINEQQADDTGRAKGEFLGGNGQTHWHHCKGNDRADKLSLSENLDHETRTDLESVVKSHQGSLEANGLYFVRELAHWRGGYDGEKHANRTERKHKQALGLPYSLTRKDRTKVGLEARKARKLARLQARRGKK